MRLLHAVKQRRFTMLEWKWTPVFCVLSFILLAAGCGGKSAVPRASLPKMPARGLAVMGYSIQIGAFSNPDNAIRLTRILEDNGLSAYYFVHKTGTYKVRFGDFPSKKAAHEASTDSGFCFHSAYCASRSSAFARAGREADISAKNYVWLRVRRQSFHIR